MWPAGLEVGDFPVIVWKQVFLDTLIVLSTSWFELEEPRKMPQCICIISSRWTFPLPLFRRCLSVGLEASAPLCHLCLLGIIRAM